MEPGAPGGYGWGKAALVSGLNPVAAGAARPLSERQIPVAPRAGLGTSASTTAPLLASIQSGLLFTQGLRYLEHPSFQTEPRARELLEGARAGSLENSGGELKITLTYTARECRFLIPTSGWMWQISGRSRRCEGKGLRDTDCYAANSPPPKAPNGSQGPEFNAQ